MGDQYKTKRQLIKELEELRQQNAQLKMLEIERTRSDMVLQGRAETPNSLYENELIAMYITSIETGRPLDANNKGVHFAGYSSKEKFLAEFVSVNYHTHPEKRKELINELRLKGDVYKKEHEFVKRDGTSLWVELYAKIHPEKGWIESALIDISERKQLENALKKSQEELEKKVAERTAALRLANEQLKEAKDHLENVIESSLDSIVVCDINGYTTKINPSFLQLLGLRKEEVIGKHMVEFGPMEKGSYTSTTGQPVQIDEKYFEKRKRMYHKLLEVGKVRNWESYLINKDKKVVFVEYNIVFLHNKEGEVTGAIGIIRDITKRKQSEDEIRQNKDFLENIFKTSVDGIMVSDSNGFITMANTATEKMVGHFHDELIGKHFVELLPKGIQNKEKGKNYQERLVKEVSIRGVEFVWVRKDGSLFDVEINSSLLKNNEDTITGVVAIIRDITERKKAEKTIEEGKKFLERVIESSMDGLAITDDKGHIMSFNPALEKMCQFRRKELIGKHISILTIDDKDLRNSILEKTRELFEKGFAKFEAVNKTKDGTHINVACHNSLIKDARGNIIAGVSIIRNITDQKLAEEELRKFKTIADRANYGVAIVDTEGNHTYTNEAFMQMHGYTGDEVIDKNLSIFYNEAQKKRLRELNKPLFDKGYFVAEEVWHKRRDGTTFPTLMSATIIRDEEDNPQFLATTILDITEKKRAEKEITETKDFLENIFKTSVDGILVSDNKGCITMANESLEKILGYTKDELQGKYTVELLPRGSMYEERGKELISILYEKSIVTSFDITWVRKDGSFIDVELNISLLRDSEGTIIGSVGAIRDITNRKRAEEKIREASDYLDNIIESSLDVVVASDSRGYITRVNKAFFELTGYREKEVIGKHITEFIPYEDGTYESTTGEMVEIKEFFSDTLEVIEKKLFAEGEITNWETYYLRKDGKVVPVETNIAYLYNEEGDTIGSVGVNRDISERKRSGRKIAEYQNELRSFASQLTLNEEKERQKFATYLHDQIGQELFAIKIKLELLKDSLSSDKDVKIISDISNSLIHTIDNTRSLTFDLSPPILYQFGLEAALEWLTEQIGEQYGIKVAFENDEQEKELSNDIKILLFQAIRELLTNVAKHAQAQNAKVSVQRDNSHMRVCVEDDGVGFTPPSESSPKESNQGFGLFSIKERLDHLGGQFDIESQPGRGTRATLLAPLKGMKESLNGK